MNISFKWIDINWAGAVHNSNSLGENIINPVRLSCYD